MDFIIQLPLTRQGHDTIVVFVDRLSKRAHFQPIHTSATVPEVAKIFFTTIFRNHGLPKVIMSDSLNEIVESQFDWTIMDVSPFLQNQFIPSWFPNAINTAIQ